MMHDVAAVLLSPFERLRHASAEDVTLGVTAAIFGFLWDPLFWVGFGILFLLNGWDYLLGVRIAYSRDEFVGHRAFNGALSKITGLLLLFTLRVVEAWAPLAGLTVGGIETGGMIATGATAVLILVEVHSIDQHARELGGRGLGPVRRALDFLFDGAGQEGRP